MELFVFHNGKVSVEETSQLQERTIPKAGFLWLDFHREEAAAWPEIVKQLTGVEIFENHVRDSFNPMHPSFSDFTENYEMIIFPSLSSGASNGGISTQPSAFFLLGQLLITVRLADTPAVHMVRKRLKQKSDHAPRKPAELLYLILNEMVEGFLALRKPLAEQSRAWEEELLETKKIFQDWSLLQNHRKQLGVLESICEEQEDCISIWRERTGAAISGQLEVRFNDLLEHIRRVLSHVQKTRFQMDSLVQLHYSAVTHRTNEIMRVLTVVAAIFLPLSLMAGIFGMNFDHMEIFHSSFGHVIALGGMACLAALLLWIFRLKEWI